MLHCYGVLPPSMRVTLSVTATIVVFFHVPAFLVKAIYA